MKLIKISATLLCLAVVAGAADFRGNSWGDSPAQVRAVEGAGVAESTPEGAPCLIYDVDLAGRADVTAVFYFAAGGRLAMGRYMAPVFGYEPFKEWEKIITDKYGEAEIADTIYSDNKFIYENYYCGGWRDIEYGVANGHFELCRYWTVEGTDIYLILVREGNNAVADLSYYSTVYGGELMDLADAADREGF